MISGDELQITLDKEGRNDIVEALDYAIDGYDGTDSPEVGKQVERWKRLKSELEEW